MTAYSNIRIGTSGYSFDDWKGPFYPAKLAKQHMFDYYATQFDTVEINATYYAIPRASVFELMARKAPAHFQFTVKAHASATHQRDQVAELTPRYLESIRPLVESGLLRGILLQFPWGFHDSEFNRRHLLKCKELLAGLPLYIEFRHASWNKPELFAWLRSHELLFVSVDEPQLPNMMPPVVHATGEAGYVRFHGRNAAAWYGSDGQERYNYLYSDNELTEWIPKITELSQKSKDVFVFFNNCRDGQAAFNARRMMQLLGIRTRTGGANESLL